MGRKRKLKLSPDSHPVDPPAGGGYIANARRKADTCSLVAKQTRRRRQCVLLSWRFFLSWVVVARFINADIRTPDSPYPGNLQNVARAAALNAPWRVRKRATVSDFGLKRPNLHRKSQGSKIAIDELLIHTRQVGKMGEAVKLHTVYGFPAPRKGGSDKNRIDCVLGDTGTLNKLTWQTSC